MQVRLLAHTPQPERVIACAARVCYSGSPIEEIWARLDEAQIERMILMLRGSRHLSVFEHASFTFGVDGLSRAASHQLVRHRIASFSQQSQRYVSFEEGFEAVTPGSIEAKGEAREAFEGLLEVARQAYAELVKLGVKKEDARFVLPNAATTRLVFTMNARELMHFFSLRLCVRAQWEIRDLAKKMLELVKPLAPLVFELAGPPCVSEGRCYEGESSCGAAPTV